MSNGPGLIVAAAVAFGFIHLAQGPIRFLTGFTIGLAWGLPRRQTGTIWPGSVMHFMINFGTPAPAWISWLVTITASLLLRPLERRTKPSPGQKQFIASRTGLGTIGRTDG